MKRDKPELLCLGSGVESLPIIQRASEDFNVVIMGHLKDSPAEQWAKANPTISESWLGNVYSPRSALQSLQKSLTKQRQYPLVPYHFAGVLCCATDCPDTQAMLAEELRVPTIGRIQAELGRDKWRQYEWLKAHNIAVPESKLIEKTDGADLARGYDVIKPVASRGARGVQVLEPKMTADEFQKAKYRALAESLPGYKQCIVQKWAFGLQLSTESVIHNGNLIFTAVALRNYDKMDTYKPYIIENGADMPFHLSPENYNNLNSLILRATLALGWDNLTVKCDIVQDGGMFTLIEIAPRLSGGFFCSHYIPHAYDYDFIGAALDLATGKKKVRIYEQGEKKYVSQRFMFPRPEWIGKKIKAMPRIVESGNVVLYQSYKHEGDTIQPVTYHGARLATVIVAGNLQSKVVQDAKSIIAEAESLVAVE